MGLEDYIRARSDQFYAPNTRDVKIHSPQRQRTPIIDKSIAGNGVPSSRFMRPLMPFQFQEAEINSQQPQQYDLPVTTTAQQEKSVFDTDIENADDTTITVTSLADVEAQDHGVRGMFDHDAISQDWDGSVLSESDHHTDGNNYYRAEDPMKVSSMTTTPRYRRKTTVPLAVTEDISHANGYKDNDRREQLDWNPAEIPRSSTAASNKRNSIANVSRIPRAKSRMSLQRSDSDPGLRSGIIPAKEPATTTNARTVQIPYRTGYSRTSNFPQSLATTPNNRFNFKSERSYERLISQQTSPTRQVSGPRPQPDDARQQRQRQQQQRRHGGSASPQKVVQTRKKLEPTSSSKVRRLLDESDVSFDDEDEEDEQETGIVSEDLDDESSGSSVDAQSLTTTDITQRKISISTTSESIDRRYQKFTSDYPDEVLQQMDFSELEKEPFDHSPGSSSPWKNPKRTTATTTPKKIKAPSPPPPPRPPPPPDTTTTPSEKLAYIMTALPNPTARHQYMSTMNITDWESLGDEILDQMSEMLKMISESRQARRRTTALFEAEIRRRHDQTMSEVEELDRKFGEMKEGGLGVLRALKP